MVRTCEQCGAKIPPQQGSARPRKFCVICRPPRNRPNPRMVAITPDVPPDDTPKLVRIYKDQLDAAGRLDSPEGAHVMHLATLFAAGNHTAAGAASLSKELRAAMEDAMRGAPKKADLLDELASRRAQKAAGA